EYQLFDGILQRGFEIERRIERRPVARRMIEQPPATVRVQRCGVGFHNDDGNKAVDSLESLIAYASEHQSPASVVVISQPQRSALVGCPGHTEALSGCRPSLLYSGEDQGVARMQRIGIGEIFRVSDPGAAAVLPSVG